MKIRRTFQLKMKRQRTVSNEDLAYFSLVLYYVWQTGNLFVQKCFGGETLLSTAIYLILAAGVGLAMLSAARKKAAHCLLAELTALLLYTISYILGYADFSVLKYNFVWTVVICIPIGFTILCMDDLEQLYHILYRMAKPVIGILCATIFLRFIVLKANEGQYDEAMSYALLFWCIILCNAVLETMKWTDMFFMLLGLGFNMLWGSRGTYLCFALFLVLKILLDISGKKRQTLIFLGGGAIILLLIIVLSLPINSLDASADELIYFRSLYKILNGEMFRSDSRIALYIYYAGLILQKPFLGWGVTGGWINSKMWPHNFFIEVLLAFGIMVGLAVIVIVLFAIAVILKESKKSERTLFIIYFSNAFALIVSGTFLQNVSFYVCLFLGVVCISRKRILKKRKGGKLDG